MSRKEHTNRMKINLYLDVAMMVAFLVSLRPFLTGLAIHEWLGLAIGGALAIHCILHWKWVTGVTKRLFQKLPLRTRIYYALDASLLIAFLTIIFSGVAMSRIVLPSIGLSGSPSMAWSAIHKLSSLVTVVLLGIKLVLHRRWIVNAVKRHVIGSHRAGPRQQRVSGRRTPVLELARVSEREDC